MISIIVLLSLPKAADTEYSTGGYDNECDAWLGSLSLPGKLSVLVDAKMVEHPAAYQWSSYRLYIQTMVHYQLNVDVILDYFPGDAWEKRKGYRVFVEDPR